MLLALMLVSTAFANKPVVDIWEFEYINEVECDGFTAVEHGMVVAKIDGLDIQSVEQLLLMVIAKHLKWINLFGGIIGALIGGIQVLISRFV